ncbi:LADA_0H01882g1_1 [Lachancea dasiensis]|uniref:Plasma membrane fusion protein PRM1 n=1 Tax=Lachancea dasiensis TaxID=1072105 RepID=A0A1G4JZP3_9SACH|nr:LADA_0H01882g1_1 [Lachancea dasiensis]
MTLKPYLQLRDRISQVWINQYTILLLLTMVKIVLFSVSLKNAIAASKNYLLSNCDTLELYYSKIVNSGPTYMCQFGNYLVTKSVEESVKASLKSLSLLVGAGEQTAIFMFDFYFGTYICLASSAVDGAVDVATNTTEKLLDFVNETVIAAGDDIDSGLNDLSQVINKVLKAVKSVEDFFKDGEDSSDIDSTVKSVNLSIAKLRDLHIPHTIDSRLLELSKKTPDFEKIMNRTHAEISDPFQLVRSKISAFNVSRLVADNELMYLPPPINASNTTAAGICTANKPDILEFYSGVLKTINVLLIILVTLLVIGALLATIPSIWSEYRQWARLQALQSLVDEKPLFDHSMWRQQGFIENYQRVYARWQTAFGDWVSQRLTSSIRTRRKIQWSIAYAFSPRALTLLAVAIAGILMCVCQFLLLAAAKRAVTSHNASQLASAADATLHDDLARWTDATNNYINASRDHLNQEVFGWTQGATSSLNNTVNAAIDDIDKVLADFFNGTLLYKPMAAVVRCTIENKLYKIQKALTWIHNNLQFPLPLIDSDALQKWIQDLQTSANATTQGSDSPTSSFTTNASRKLVTSAREVLDNLLRQFYSATIIELTISLTLLGLWILQWLIAVCLTITTYHQV